MTSVSEYQQVQNGGASVGQLAFDPTFRFIRNGRDLAAYTHVDVLYQAYFIAFLVLTGIGTPPNPGNPYIGSRTEKAFCTLGLPDAAATLGPAATSSKHWRPEFSEFLRGKQIAIIADADEAENVKPRDFKPPEPFQIIGRPYEDELVLGAVPMTLAGPHPWRQGEEIDPEGGETAGLAQL